jgi:NAD(P)-dependent dehydrogenase (short-subunit alcohol dehydrogenase family)
VNLQGQILCAHRALPGMIARRGGHIINIASGGGATMLPYFSAYVTSKTALIRFSECLAFEVKDHGIAVFAMGPGTVRTAMSEYSLNSPEGRTWLPWFRDTSMKAATCARLRRFWSPSPGRRMSCQDVTYPRTISIVDRGSPGNRDPEALFPAGPAALSASVPERRPKLRPIPGANFAWDMLDLPGMGDLGVTR